MLLSEYLFIHIRTHLYIKVHAIGEIAYHAGYPTTYFDAAAFAPKYKTTTLANFEHVIYNSVYTG